MPDVLGRAPLLRSSAVSFAVTTLFNFTSISLLLWFAYSSIESTLLATLSAHAAGMLVSMAFCLDWWWTRVSMQMPMPVTLAQRARFLGIATISALVATVVVRLGTMDTVRSSTFLILLNWLGLGLIALVKYLILITFVAKMRASPAAGSR